MRSDEDRPVPQARGRFYGAEPVRKPRDQSPPRPPAWEWPEHVDLALLLRVRDALRRL